MITVTSFVADPCNDDRGRCSVNVAEPNASALFKNILLATDLSPALERALQYAQAFARAHAAVHTLRVRGSNIYELLRPEAFSATFDTARNHRSATKVLSSFAQRLPSEGPVRGSRVGEIIAGVAARNEIDLVILGTQGRKGLPKLVFGSVVEELFRDVACPVLTVGSEVKAPDPAGLKISKVLLATDCNATSLAPIYAAWICQRFGAGLFVLHVVGKEADLRVVTSSQVRERLAVLGPEITKLQRLPEFSVEWGEPASKILQVAGELGADLMVLGAHAPRDVRAQSRPPWATVARLIAEAVCPVLTVPDTVSSSWI